MVQALEAERGERASLESKLREARTSLERKTALLK